ncbi:MAG: hypothetical protein N3A02_01150 [Rectinema sp.]|nr:hypothetical protein [Rectinema sp.]
MEVPLRLSVRRDGSLFFGVPLYVRIVMGAMFLLLGSAIVAAGFQGGLFGWFALVLLLMGLLYREDWLFNPATRNVHSAIGFLPMARKQTIAFEDIEALQLAAFSKGTVPGSADERHSDQEAFDTMRGKPGSETTQHWSDPIKRRKLYMSLLLITKEGEKYLLDMSPARKATRLAQAGRAIAALIGCHFIDSFPEE